MTNTITDFSSIAEMDIVQVAAVLLTLNNLANEPRMGEPLRGIVNHQQKRSMTKSDAFTIQKIVRHNNWSSLRIYCYNIVNDSFDFVAILCYLLTINDDRNLWIVELYSGKHHLQNGTIVSACCPMIIALECLILSIMGQSFEGRFVVNECEKILFMLFAEKIM